MNLGERLKKRRKAKGLSQEKVAEIIGVSRQAVTKWEADQSTPSSDNLIALASLFQVPLDELVTGGNIDSSTPEIICPSKTRKILILIIVCLSISSVVFGFLWQKEKADKSGYLIMAQAGANDAAIQFSEYQNNGKIEHYWYGVASFRVFEQAYYSFAEGTNKSSNYSICNDVYGNLVLFPEKCQPQIAEIIEVMEIIANDANDRNGFILMENLRNSLNHSK